MVRHALLASAALAFVLSGCDSGDDDRFKVEKGYTPPSERKQKEYTPEELEKIRKEQGFKSQDELIEEAKTEMEESSKKYVKAKLDDFKGLAADLTKMVDDIEAGAAKWAKAKDPDKAFEKFEPELKERVKAYEEAFKKTTNEGIEGGNTTAHLTRAFEEFKILRAGLSGKVGENEKLPGVVTKVRDAIAVVTKELEEIEKDDSIVPDAGDGGAEGEGDAKADAKK